MHDTPCVNTSGIQANTEMAGLASPHSCRAAQQKNGKQKKQTKNAGD